MATIAVPEYEFIRKLVYEHSRINLGTDKTELVSRRVHKRLRALKLSCFEEYCDYLKSAGGADELTDLIDVISTNVTEFFRESRHFDFLRQTVLPAWLHSKQAQAGNPFKIWSAACSSGEEPYTMAIVLAEFGRQNSSFRWQVEGADISTRILATAEQAIYAADKVKLPSTELLNRYFQKGMGQYEGYYRIKKELRQHVTFHHANLFQGEYPVAREQDVIFCRNVMIYFDRATQEQLVRKLIAQLAPGGYLFVGHSESLIGIKHNLRSLQPSVYRKE